MADGTGALATGQVNSRRWQGDEVLVRFVGGDPADDMWINISDAKRVRPPQGPVGNQYAQVGNHAKVGMSRGWCCERSCCAHPSWAPCSYRLVLSQVMFLEDRGKGNEPVWYPGEITGFSRRSPGEGKPEEWMFTIDFEDEEQHHVKLPDPEVRIIRPASDLMAALTDMRDAAREALEDYANRRELQVKS